MNVTMNMKYKTKSGFPVEILKVGLVGTNYPVVGVITYDDGNQNMEGFTSDGRYYDDGTDSEYDLVEMEPYEDFAIDQPVYVRLTSACKVYFPRHFAGVSDSGKALIYQNGLTSHTSGNKYKIVVHECLSVGEYKTKFNYVCPSVD